MLDKHIRYWARIVSESYEKNCSKVVSEEKYGLTRYSELTKNINGIVSPDLYKRRHGETKDLYMADFRVNTTDTGSLFHSFGEQVKGIPEGMIFIYFMCLKDSVTLKRMCDYVNSTCSDVLPKKFEPSQFIKISPVRANGGREMDLYLTPDGVYQKTEEYLRENFLATNEEYRPSGLMYKHGDHKYLSRLFSRHPKILKNLDSGSRYLILFYIKDTLTPSSVVNVFNKLNNSKKNAMIFKKSVTSGDVVNLGNLRLKNKRTGDMMNLDVCAVKTER